MKKKLTPVEALEKISSLQYQVVDGRDGYDERIREIINRVEGLNKPKLKWKTLR